MATLSVDYHLQESHERLAFALQSAGLCSWEIDVANDRVTASAEMLSLWGVDPHSFDGRRAVLQSKVRPDDRDVMRSAIEAAISNGGIYECEYRIYPQAKSERWVLSRGRCTFDPITKKVLKLAGVVSDITERKRYAERLQAAFDLSGSGASQIDPQSGRYLRVNERFAQLFGYSSSNLSEMTLFDLLEGSGSSVWSERHSDLLSSGASGWREERCYRSSQGQPVWVICSGFIQRDSTGQAIEILNTVFDISDLKQTQFELERAIETRDQFLSLASHELKTPLTSLKLQIELRQRELRRLDSNFVDIAVVQKSLSQQMKSVEKLTGLIDRVLDASMMSRGKLDYKFETHNLSECLRETVDLFVAQSTHQEIRLKIENEIQAEIDLIRIHQVFSNLLSNASKYGAGQPIDVTLSSRDDCAIVNVADAGIGIQSKDFERIFKKFERAVSKNEVAGLGLGLFLVKEVVDAHLGSIEVRSAPGQGSNFTVTLPLRRQSE